MTEPAAPPPAEFEGARPSRFGRQSALGLLVGLLLVAFAAYTAFWFYVRDQAETIVARAIEDQREAGYDLTWSAMSWGGFPGRVTVSFNDPAVAAPGDYGGWRWAGEGLQLALWPFDFQTVYIDLIGDQRFAQPGRRSAAMDGETMAASITYDQRGAITALSVTAREVSAHADGARVADIPVLRARVRRDEDADTYRLTANMERPRFAGISDEDAPERVVARGALSSADAFMLYRGVDPRALAAWSEASGRLVVEEACFVWPSTDETGAADAIAVAATAAEESCFSTPGPAVSGEGDFRLDAQGRWNGQLSLSAREPRAAFERLGGLGVLPVNTAAQAGAVAESMAGGGVLSAPVTVRNGGVYFFLIRLATLPQAY